MIILLISTLLAIALIVYEINNADYLSYSGLLILILGTFLSFCPDIILKLDKKVITKVTKNELISINSSNNLEGEFHLGTGEIKGKNYLNYVFKDDLGNVSVNRMPYNKIVLKELKMSSRGYKTTPYVEVIESFKVISNYDKLSTFQRELFFIFDTVPLKKEVVLHASLENFKEISKP